MGIFKDFEKKLESLFEGVFLRAFKSGVHPVELGKKLVRELEGHKTIGVSRVYVPNRYQVGLSQRDYSRFESYQAVMASELENLLISYIKDKGYAVLDRPRIRLVEEDSLREGEFWIRCRTEGEIPPGAEPAPARGADVGHGRPEGPACLELMGSGDVAPFFALELETTRIGRTTDNEIMLPDPNVSRLHASITRRGGSYYINDLDSTNGTWVNEQRVTEAELSENDVVRLGGTRLVFRRSQD